LNDSILQAYNQAQKELGENTKIIFVGDYNDDEYYRQLMALVDGFGLTNQMEITGYLEDSEYKNYLISADVAVQLRQRSRGETSAAVLDCMNYGLPTIVNAHGTF
jgi:glycosyltransferase involved in cell wall biosynthesis